MLLYYVGEIPHKSFRLITRLAQLVERKTFNLVVEGSSPSSGVKITRNVITCNLQWNINNVQMWETLYWVVCIFCRLSHNYHLIFEYNHPDSLLHDILVWR
jgi:hypothetical protein